jgi:hypothetical protein
MQGGSAIAEVGSQTNQTMGHGSEKMACVSDAKIQLMLGFDRAPIRSLRVAVDKKRRRRTSRSPPPQFYLRAVPAQVADLIWGEPPVTDRSRRLSLPSVAAPQSSMPWFRHRYPIVTGDSKTYEQRHAQTFTRGGHTTDELVVAYHKALPQSPM